MPIETLRPTGDGTVVGGLPVWSPFPAAPATRYDKVNEESSDDETSYISSPDWSARQHFTKDNIAGIPVSVTVKGVARRTGVGTDYLNFLISHSPYTDNYSLSAAFSLTDSYVEYSHTWSVNPWTSQPWTESEVNDLEFGVHQGTTGSNEERLTQFWMEVDMAVEVTVADVGTNQQEAVGMGAAEDPVYESATVNAALPLTDAGAGVEAATVLASMIAADTGAGLEAATIAAMLQEILDTGAGVDALALAAGIYAADTGVGAESAVIAASAGVAETGAGLDVISSAKAYFFVTEQGILNPLGIIVLRDSRQDLMPGTRENVDTVPGKHGEIDFGSEFQPRFIELHVCTDGSMSGAQREQIKRTIARYLNPVVGPKSLIFADDIEKTYQVKYAGKINLNRMLDNWLEFVIPFKASDPLIIGTYEKTATGDGTLTNEGTFETPLVIEIAGPVTDPSVVIGSDTLTWTGDVGAGETLEIDTEYMTVKLDGVNALSTYSGGFPKLQVGDTAVTAALAGTTTFTWRDRWI